MVTFEEFMRTLNLVNEGAEILADSKKVLKESEERHERFRKELANSAIQIEACRRRHEAIQAICNEKLKGINDKLANM